jgi:hypothetical protein
MFVASHRRSQVRCRLHWRSAPPASPSSSNTVNKPRMDPHCIVLSSPLRRELSSRHRPNTTAMNYASGADVCPPTRAFTWAWSKLPSKFLQSAHTLSDKPTCVPAVQFISSLFARRLKVRTEPEDSKRVLIYEDSVIPC